MTSHGQFIDINRIQTETFIRHVELHDSLPSTNDRALTLAADAALETPALVIARHQTAGRGRGDHKWWSTDGALTLSLIIDTAAWGITQRDWPRLSLTTAVAVCDAIANELSATDKHVTDGESLGIKWPNDVLIDGRKICGILIESPGGSRPGKDRLVIGIGINVNNSWHGTASEVGTLGTALCNETGRTHDTEAVLVSLLQSLERRIEQLAIVDAQLPAAWQRLCWLTQRHVKVRSENSSTDGICLGIGTDGALLVENTSGTHRIHSGSVQLH